jgi:hypothetical protein
MTDDERRRIAEEADFRSEIKQRVKVLESQLGFVVKGLVAIASAIGITIWNSLSGGIFK